jgi:hypothetical protein
MVSISSHSEEVQIQLVSDRRSNFKTKQYELTANAALVLKSASGVKHVGFPASQGC